MFPIAGVPLIQHHVEGLVAAGITEIIVVVRAGSEVVQNHFAPAPALEQHLAAQGKEALLAEVRRITQLADIVFVRQPESLPYGNGSPALAARPWLTSGEPFYYMFGDDIVVADRPVPQQLCKAFEDSQPAAALAVQAVPDEETHLYGCAELRPGSENEIARIVEKPAPGTAPSNLVQIGHFVFTSELFDVLTPSDTGQGGELWLTEAVARLAAHSRVIVQPVEGKWMAAGDPLRQLKASIEMTLQLDDMRDDMITYLRSLDLG
jgi:UTP--glucose-1-phosphate uridylyltransferase